MPTAVSLFTGCGGSDLGLIQTGFNIVLANDVLPYAKDVYLANLPETDYRLGDISKIRSFPRADLLVGCYPCQGYSQGGARDPERKINYLYREFDRALRCINPKAFIVENVGGMRRANVRHLLNNQIVRFRLAGYTVKWEVLDAKDYGVPQDRERIFIVGIRADLGEKFDFPQPTHGPGNENPYTVLRDVIADMDLWPDGEYWPDPFHWYYMSRNRRRGWGELSRTIVSHPRHTPLHPLSPCLKKLGPDRWAFANNGRARRLSFREASRIQGFPAEMAFPDSGSLRMKYRVVGNAVPPPLFQAIASALPPIW